MLGSINPLSHAAPEAALSPQTQPHPTQKSTAMEQKAQLTAVLRWLLHDAPYIALLLLALVGVIFRLPVAYWVILTPVFAVISAAAGWRYCVTMSDRLELIVRLALCWGALLLAIYLLYNNGVRGVLNANGQSLAMMTLLALGTFVAGVQSRVWRICVVGGLLFLAVPALGWLDQSPLLLTAATLVIIAVGAAAWWLSQLFASKPAEIKP